MKICEYGCEQEVKYYFPTVDKWCCSKSHNQCPENRRKNSEANRGKKSWNEGKTGVFSKEALRRMSEAKNGKKRAPFSKETKKRMSKAKKRENLSEETLKRKSKTMKEAHKDPNSGLGSNSWKEKQRISAIKNIENRCGQCSPNYSPLACKLIDGYGIKNGYNFQHAENGGEYYIKKLGYWVDGYDKEKNIVIEVDESHHFDIYGDLKERDIQRQTEIEKYLNCEFIRLRI